VNRQSWPRVLGLGATMVLIGLSACQAGTPAVPPAAPASPTPSPSPAGPTTELTIVVDLGQGGTPTTWRLTCDPAGGSHPDPVGACQALEVNGASALPPVPKDRACTMIYGGPERATVTGTWNGRDVASTFSRTNGCEINRWGQMVPLLPEPTT
jgi:Subtilisin inhibitor-like